MVSEHSKTLMGLTNTQNQIQKKQDQWLAAHGISYREFVIMLCLDQAPARNMKRIELAEQVGLSASGVTRMLNPMEKIGLITKEEAARDARVSLVRLTNAGQQLLRDATRSFNERAKAFIEGITEAQYDAIRELSQTRL